jgi:hypothetical protein
LTETFPRPPTLDATNVREVVGACATRQKRKNCRDRKKPAAPEKNPLDGREKFENTRFTNREILLYSLQTPRRGAPSKRVDSRERSFERGRSAFSVCAASNDRDRTETRRRAENIKRQT